MIEVLLLRLLFQPELHDSVVKHRRRLQWAVKHGLGNLYWDCLGVILQYDEKFGKLPTRKSLLEFVTVTEAKKLEVVGPIIKDIKTSVTPEAYDAISDIDVLIDFVFQEARKEWVVAFLNTAKGKVYASSKKGPKGPEGPEAAMAYVLKAWADDFKETESEGVILGDVADL